IAVGVVGLARLGYIHSRRIPVVVALGTLSAFLFVTAVSPEADEPLRWYDRLLRFLGGLVTAMFAAYGWFALK
ncbi:MAG TPA: hypothetical protein VMU24_02070, partial [Candidatus Acidoferrales bacterium]|nr:hypothetical protein [Candidatus Acidoferrales bacterium]